MDALAPTHTRQTLATSIYPGASQVLPNEALLDDIVRQIVLGFHPIKVILFGSHAYGEPGPASDVDLLVVMETPTHEIEQAVEICQNIDYHFGLDLIVCTPANLNRRLTLGDPFLREITGKGKVLYERAH